MHIPSKEESKREHNNNSRLKVSFSKQPDRITRLSLSNRRDLCDWKQNQNHC